MARSWRIMLKLTMAVHRGGRSKYLLCVNRGANRALVESECRTPKYRSSVEAVTNKGGEVHQARRGRDGSRSDTGSGQEG